MDIVTQPQTDVADIPRTGPLSLSEAASALARARYSKEPPAQTSTAADSGAAEPPQQPPQSTAQAEDAGPPQEVPGETQDADPAEQPSIERPRSWTKELDERWQALPRDLQEVVAERDRDRETALLKGQQEAAEKRKSYETKAQEAEQARQKYETALPVILESAKQQFLSDFPDVRGQADIDRLIKEDPQRYLLLQNRINQMHQWQQQIIEGDQRKDTEKRTKFSEFAKEQDKLFSEKIPEAELKTLMSDSTEYLKSKGFTENELGEAWHGMKDISIRDHRMQNLIVDAMRWRNAEAAKAKLTQAKKPVPPVQRPGTSRPSGADNEAQIQALNAQLDSGKLTVRQQLEVAAKLRALRDPFTARKAS